jgi:DNA-binding transcriptional ArsR family regulator/cell division protein FtsB
VSVSDEEPYSTIFASLKHPIRRRILRMLSKEPMSFSEMLGVLGVSSSFLNYHLENLGELVSKIEDGKYRLSSFGEAAMATMTKVEDIPTTSPQQYPEHPETRSQKWSRPLGIIPKAFKMSETKASETKPKKVVGRNVAIALGIICILLIAFIAYFSITGISAQNSYNNLKNQNKQLQMWLDGNETLLNHTQANNTNLQNQIDSLNSNVTNLQNQANNFNILSTKNSTVWVDNQNVHLNASTIVGWGEDASSAGYISIRVSSNSNSTYIEVILWNTSTVNQWFTGINTTFPNPYMDYEVTVGFGGTVIFPVLPTSGMSIDIGIDNSLFLTPKANSSLEEATVAVIITYYY